MLLVYPPVAKSSEPPAGIARLAGALTAHSVKHTLLDANLEGLLWLTATTTGSEPTDRWTARVSRNRLQTLDALRYAPTYRCIDKYKRAVLDLNRWLQHVTSSRVSLANYEDAGLSPLRSDALRRAAELPETSPFYPYFSARLPSLIEDERPKIAGFSISYLSQALPAFSMIGFLKKRFPSLLIVCGGGLITSWLHRPGWNNHFAGLVDLFVDGPGEDTMLRLAGIKPDAMTHSVPDYNKLPLASYLSPGAILPYSASHGCLWNRCSFCPEHAEENIFVPIAARAAVEEINMLTGRLKPRLIHLLDNALSPALLQAIIANPPGVPWYGFVRITEALTDPDYCDALRHAGCVMLKLGIESGDQHVLDALCKGISIETASAALRSLKQAGIGTYVYLLFGTPPESESAARKTLAFTAAHAEMIGFLNLAIFSMPIGSCEARQYPTFPFSYGDLSLYTDFEHPSEWHRKKVRHFLDREFKRCATIAPIIRRDPPIFTSNHAPFFLDALRRGDNPPES